MNTIKAIIFDVDGVLISSKDEQGEYIWHKNIQAKLGIDAKCLSSIYSGNWSLVMKGMLNMQQHVANVFSECSIDLPIDSFIDYWLKNDLKINESIVTLIRQLKTHKRYLGTNQDFLRAAVIWNKFGQDFDGFFPSCQLGAIKPEVNFFKHIENALNLASHEIAFIDDSKTHIETATRLGWICHHYKNIEGFKDFIETL